jgi:hypothetical protein
MNNLNLKIPVSRKRKYDVSSTATGVAPHLVSNGLIGNLAFYDDDSS